MEPGSVKSIIINSGMFDDYSQEVKQKKSFVNEMNNPYFKKSKITTSKKWNKVLEKDEALSLDSLPENPFDHKFTKKKKEYLQISEMKWNSNKNLEDVSMTMIEDKNNKLFFEMIKISTKSFKFKETCMKKSVKLFENSDIIIYYEEILLENNYEDLILNFKLIFNPKKLSNKIETYCNIPDRCKLKTQNIFLSAFQSIQIQYFNFKLQVPFETKFPRLFITIYDSLKKAYVINLPLPLSINNFINYFPFSIENQIESLRLINSKNIKLTS